MSSTICAPSAAIRSFSAAIWLSMVPRLFCCSEDTDDAFEDNQREHRDRNAQDDSNYTLPAGNVLREEHDVSFLVDMRDDLSSS
jgi:hypothetical protein